MRITRQKMRTTGIACGAAAASALLGMAGATQSGAISTAIVIGGIGTPTLHDVVMSQLLGGALQDYDQRVSVNWPAEARPYTGADDMTLGQSIEIGRANLDAQIDDALAQLERDADGNPLDGEVVTVVGLSAGSLVVTETLRAWQTDGEEDPAAKDINFVVVADSSRQEIIDDTEEYNEEYDYTYRQPPETVYDTVEITGEYDGMADFPDRFSFTAIQNALLGSTLVHVPMMFSDISEVPKENTTVTENSLGGTTVRYLVPTEPLPLVQANPSLAPREAELRATIDRAYSRNDPANVAARLAGPDVPESIREIVTPEVDEVEDVDLANAAALQEEAEADATTKADQQAPSSLSEQLSDAASVEEGDEADSQPTTSTITSALESVSQQLAGAADEDGTAALTPESGAAAEESTDSSESTESDAAETKASTDRESADSSS
ncbi:PE-PPE domain-containing protein [Mycolicibacterium iranicum]|uniref:PE-PPE domain-containing protein n=2 Tax=Mycolicibacterium iranicum TaxID=912594 RepID=A0A1X1WCV2_MYCIR|nr:PE-PPE domain-containing protein [Mycolicibacterium iranicum]MCZ0727017.1 PE-PPE domain-containing protein [Mycolicibacterium iranicum]ORV84391.1 PE-PPE domain-containing protein [Mycolicibacterium iranicum]